MVNWWDEAPLAPTTVQPPSSGTAWWQSVPLAPPERTPAQRAAVPFQGFNVGLANVLGAPVDVANLGLGLIPGYTPSPEPVGGSAMLRRGLESVGAGYRSLQDVPETMRPVARFGEILGEATPIAAAPLAAARAGATGGRYLAPVVGAARRMPGAFTAAEAGGAVGAGLGGAAAEYLMPGNRLVSAGAEIAGGVASPAAAIARAARGASSAAQRITAALSPAGREQMAARSLQETVRAAAEEPTTLVTPLREPAVAPTMTPAQRTESPALIGLERRLAKDIPELDTRLQERIKRTTNEINTAYQQAVGSGDSALIREAARERARWFNSLMETRLAGAEQRAFEQTVGLKPTVGRGEAGITARNILEDALSDARAGERDLWSQVPRDVTVPSQATLDAYDAARGRLLEEESLPTPVEAFVDRLIGLEKQAIKVAEGGTIPQGELIQPLTSGDLLRFRSRLLSMQRDMRSGQNVDWTTHEALGDIASGVLDDLADVPGTDEARAFSYQLNNLFSRGEVGRLLGFEAAGGARIPPEMTLERALGGAGTRADVASRQIEQAAQLEGLPGVTARTTMPAQEQFVRNLATRAMDPQGRISPQALETFRRENRELLQQFPDLADQLSTARDAQQFVEATRRMTQQAQQAVQNRAAFARVANMEDPARAVGNVLRGANPMREYRELTRLARRGGPDAQAGLRQATFDYLFSQATNPQGLISGQRMRDLMTSRVTEGAPTLMDTMRSGGVLNSEQRKNLMRVMSAAQKVERTLASGARISETLGDVSALEDLMTRVIGANIGGTGTVGQISGAPLVAAQAGSKYARTIAQKIPAARTREALMRAVEDPQFMAALLSKGKSPTQRRAMERQINAFLLQTALPVEQER